MMIHHNNTLNVDQHRHLRRAFTLLETVLALSLAGLLLAGLYAAVDQSCRLTASGHVEMERAQLARAIIHRFELDIRSITYQPPPPVEDSSTDSSTSSSSSSSSSSSGSSSQSGGGSSQGGGSQGGSSQKSGSQGGSTSNSSSSSGSSSSSSSSSSTTDDTTTTTPNSKPIGIRGTNLQMEMSIIRPRRDLLPGSGQTLIPMGTSDLREVTYAFMPQGSSMSGLIRTEGDRMTVEQTEANGGQAMQVSNGQMLAPEVSALNFRYFDGMTWQTVWDSDSVGRVPRAVEVTVVFVPIQMKPSIFNQGVSHSSDTFRTVIMIPISDPYPKELVQ